MKTKQRAIFEVDHYKHFGIHPSIANMYGHKPEEIVELEMEVADDQTIPDSNGKYLEADYWGWFDNVDQDFCMIYPQRFLMAMCFPYGVKAAEEKNQGKAYRLKIINQ